MSVALSFIHEYIPLKEHTTIRIGGPARYFSRPLNIEEIKYSLQFAKEKGSKIYLITGGSDIVFPDRGFDGMVMRLDRIKGIERISEDEVLIYAGESLPNIAITLEKWGLSGFEYLFGVPGRIGGAIAKNAGAYGIEIKELLTFVDIITWDGELRRFSPEELSIRYRESDVLKFGIVYRAGFRLKNDSPENIRKRRIELSEKRKKTQPYGVPTAGCMFKNPPGKSAGKLLDSVGMKGERKGDIIISDKHANFFINLGNGRSEDVIYLIELARKRVFEEYGIKLEEEVIILR